MDLTEEENRLVFDHFFGCAEQERNDIASALISSNPKAAEIYTCAKRVLGQLEFIENEVCPTELANMTITRLKLASLTQKSDL